MFKNQKHIILFCALWRSPDKVQTVSDLVPFLVHTKNNVIICFQYKVAAKGNSKLLLLLLLLYIIIIIIKYVFLPFTLKIISKT